MHDWIELQIWHRRHEDLLWEVEVRRLATASQAAGQVRIDRIPALKRELQRHVGRAAKLVVRSRWVWRELTGKGAS